MPALVIFYCAYQQVGLGEPVGTNPSSNFVLITICLFMVIFICLFYAMALVTQITWEGVFYKWAPFNKSFYKIGWNEIKNAEVTGYDFVGYGIRLSAKYGTVHNVNGNKGLLMNLTNWKKKLIVIQRPLEL